MLHARTPIAAAAVLALGTPSTTHAVVIDDFESGPDILCFATVTSPCEIFQTGIPAPHSFAPSRSQRLYPDASATISQSPTLFTDDGLRVEFAAGGGRYLHTNYFPGCDGPGVDFTDGGTHDRIAFRFEQVGMPLELDIEIVWEGGFFSSFLHLDVATAGTHTVLLDAPITTACWMRVEVHADSPGAFCLTDIRTAAPGFELVCWVQDYLTTIGTPPLARATWEGWDGNDEVAGTVGLTVESVWDIGGNDVSLEVGIAGVASPCASWSQAFQGTAWFAGLPAAVALQMVLLFDFEAPSGPLTLPEAPEVRVYDGRFEITFPTHDRDGEWVNAAWRNSMLFEIPDGADWRIVDLWTEVPPVPHPQQFEVHLLVEPTGDPDPDDEFLQMSMASFRAVFGGPATAVVESATASAASLRAVPSVTSSGTRFVLGNAARADATLDVFDVRGRRVASLPMRDGETAWDTRDEGGAWLASGVFLARVRGTQETARVTLVR